MPFCVYKIVNSKNNGIYIGATAKSIDLRWRVHLSCAKTNVESPLYIDMRSIGSQCFKIELIESCFDKDHMKERESYWICYFKEDERFRCYNKLLNKTKQRQKQIFKPKDKNHILISNTLMDRGIFQCWIWKKGYVSKTQLSYYLKGIRSLDANIIKKIKKDLNLK